MQALLRFLASLALLSLVGCATGLKAPGPSPVDASALERIAALRQQGDYRGAAVALQQLAVRTQPPNRQDLLLQAGDAWLIAGDPVAATGALDLIDPHGLDAGLSTRRDILGARIALAEGRPDGALATLDRPPPGSVPVELQLEFLRLRAQAYRDLGQGFDSARTWIDRDTWMYGSPDQVENQLEILQDLVQLPAATLQRPPVGTLEPMRGWMELALELQDPRLGPDEAWSRFSRWQQLHPSHPARGDLIPAFLDRRVSWAMPTGQIAVMLPFSGRYPWLAEAIRDGIITAYLEDNGGSRPPLRFYDVGDAASVWPIYQQAVSEGAGQIIGPLDKEGVELLARSGPLPVPVLALNEVATLSDPSSRIYQFALAPEDEARQAASHAWELGFSRALAFTPADQWGPRLAAAFREQWESLGGTIVAARTYDPERNDFRSQLRELISLADENSFLFLAARPAKARQILPQWSFHGGTRVPVFATSHVYDASPASENLDLNGVRYTEIPWLVDPWLAGEPSLEKTSASIPGFLVSHFRFYAMGIDAYRLLRDLAAMRGNASALLQGATGELRVDAAGKIRRRLVWGEIQNGRPVPEGYGLNPEPDSQESPASLVGPPSSAEDPNAWPARSVR